MTSAICTLFEGHYHFGVAALSNSLYANGFRGTIYAGYRGDLPRWANEAVTQSVGKWEQARVLQVAEGLQLVFVPLTTDYHLTNYKPDFMLELLDGPAHDTDAICYLDPDICLVEQWGFFEDWISCGVALCEDVNSPLPKNHPRRVGWRRYFAKYGFELKFRAPEYVNGGFVGVTRNNFGFLSLWRNLQRAMADEIGGLAASKLTSGMAYLSKGFAKCFDASDQDALNAAVEAGDFVVSVMGTEAMGFKHGGAVLPHALGPGKPWQKNNMLEALAGRPPRFVDKLFWRYVGGPISCFCPSKIALQKLGLSVSTLIGRFYRRG